MLLNPTHCNRNVFFFSKMTLLDQIKKEGNKQADFRNIPKKKPIWYNEESYKRGQNFIKDHFFLYTLATTISVPPGFAIIKNKKPGIFDKPFVTGKKAYQRYNRGFDFVTSWCLYDIWSPDSKAYKKLEGVNTRHAREQDRTTKNSEDYISQYDMAQVI